MVEHPPFVVVDLSLISLQSQTKNFKMVVSALYSFPAVFIFLKTKTEKEITSSFPGCGNFAN